MQEHPLIEEKLSFLKIRLINTNVLKLGIPEAGEIVPKPHQTFLILNMHSQENSIFTSRTVFYTASPP